MKKLRGIIPPLVTPLNKDGDLDPDGLEKLIEHVIKGGVHGIFILGTTGELPRLSAEMKKELIEKTCQIVDNRLPVLVGITDPCFYESLRLEKIANNNNANGVVVAPPFYYHVTQNELLEYFKDLAGQSTLPVFLYNMPARTNINIEIKTVVKAASIPAIAGIKDSSCDFFYLQKLLYKLKGISNFSVFAGPEELMSQAVQMGVSGGVNGGANLFPELFVRLYEASIKNSTSEIKRLQDLVIQISSTLYTVGNEAPNFIKIIKEALNQKGICQPYMTKPYIPFSDQEKLQIKQCLNKIKY